MKITRTSPISKTVNTLDLDITAEQILDYESGALVQHAFPNLDADEREFFMTGITGEEWEEMFGEEEDDVDEWDEANFDDDWDGGEEDADEDNL